MLYQKIDENTILMNQVEQAHELSTRQLAIQNLLAMTTAQNYAQP
jgi:hypothetical protein